MKKAMRLFLFGLFVLLPAAGFAMEREEPVMVDVGVQVGVGESSGSFFFEPHKEFFCKCFILNAIIDEMFGFVVGEGDLLRLFHVLGKDSYGLSRNMRKKKIFKSHVPEDMDFSFLGESLPFGNDGDCETVHKHLKNLRKSYEKEANQATWNLSFDLDVVAKELCSLSTRVFNWILMRDPIKCEKFYVSKALNSFGASQRHVFGDSRWVIHSPLLRLAGVLDSPFALAEVCRKSLKSGIVQVLLGMRRADHIADRFRELLTSFDEGGVVHVFGLRSDDMRDVDHEVCEKIPVLIRMILDAYDDCRVSCPDGPWTPPTLKRCLELVGIDMEEDEFEGEDSGSEESEDEDGDSDESDIEFFNCQ